MGVDAVGRGFLCPQNESVLVIKAENAQQYAKLKGNHTNPMLPIFFLAAFLLTLHTHYQF